MNDLAELYSDTADTGTQTLRERFDSFKARGLKLNLTRGKPSSAQLELSQQLLDLPGKQDWIGEDGTDCRNYGGLNGLIEIRRLFSGIMGTPAEQLIVAGNSSLALMHDTVTWSLLKGTCDSSNPWMGQGEISFICPVPGYDRHFRICQDYGIRMIQVAMLDDGPDMDAVERLVGEDPTIKAMWCMPKYSNPTGTVYSDEVINRLSKMKTAAADFRLLWDNAYAVHHLTSERVEIANILQLCSDAGNPNRPLIFASTSKITFAGAGLALFAASAANVKWMMARFTPRTIGHDKLNQLRHVRLLKDEEGVFRLMENHRTLIAPKFDTVIDVFERELSGLAGVSWTQPKGGYFITLTVPAGCAQQVVDLAGEIGIELTPAGATHPMGIDPEDRTIRIAPTFPELREVKLAAEGVSLSVQLAVQSKSALRP